MNNYKGCSLKGCNHIRGVTRQMVSVQDVIDTLSDIKIQCNDTILEPKDIPFVLSIRDKKYVYGEVVHFLRSLFDPHIILNVDYSMRENCSDKVIVEENERLKEENKRLNNILRNIKECL